MRSRLSSDAPSYLVNVSGRRQPLWVVKTFPLEQSEAPGRRLRPDLADLACVGHSSLALPVSLGRDPERSAGFLVRPYVEGSDVTEALRGLEPRGLYPWLLAIAESLEVLHRFGFLHRGLKSSNVIVPREAIQARQPRLPRVVLCDAAFLADDGAARAGDGSAAPEICRGEKATFATDLYALGTIAYQLLAGQLPRHGGEGLPASPREANREVPLDLERLVLRLLSPEPSRRYQEASVLADDLARLGGLERRSRPGAAAEVFVGRREELAEALAGLRDRERPAALAVTGEAGMGKSAFLRRLGLEAELLGFRTVTVRCHEESGVALSLPEELGNRLVPPGRAGRSPRARLRSLLSREEPPSDADDDLDEPDSRRLLAAMRDHVVSAAADAPTLILVDEVHLADRLGIGLLSELVRETAAISIEGPTRRPKPPSIAVSFRSESPFRAALAGLLEAFRPSRKGRVFIELGPLDRGSIESWLEAALPRDASERDWEALAARSGGSPLALREAVRLGGRLPDKKRASTGRLPALHRRYLDSLAGEERELLEVLALLGRPAAPELLAAVLGQTRSLARAALEGLESAGTLSVEGGRVAFRHGSFRGWLREEIPAGRARVLHGRLAAALASRRGEPIEEVARHWIRSDSPQSGVQAFIAAARRRARAMSAGTAGGGEELEFYRAALQHLPERGRTTRRAILEEMAESLSRSGRHRSATRVLNRLLPGARRARDRGRLCGRLGVFLHRAGEIAAAKRRLEEALNVLVKARGPGAIRERLRVECELAEIAKNRGDHALAEAICARALSLFKRQAGVSSDRRIRRSEMVLLETLAHLRLRRFEYVQARELFEKSLRISNELGVLSDRSLILNNLGILHNQENRFAEAIQCYLKAEGIASRLGEDAILVSIHSNLALLHAKTGEPEAAAENLRQAAIHDARCESPRMSFLRFHSEGLVDLHFGRYASGIKALRTAISRGEALNDSYVTAFDLVYLAECHLFRGEIKAARSALDRALSVGSSLKETLGSLVEVRRALLCALRGKTRQGKALCASLEARPAVPTSYLDAWNRLYLGWARRLLGLRESAWENIEEARAFFSKVKAPGGEIHAELELAALEIEAGNGGRAEKRLLALQSRTTCGRGPLRSPMLSARLLLLRTRLAIERSPADLEEAAQLLVEAESFLAGHRVADLEAEARRLRRRLRAGAPRGPAPSPIFPAAGGTRRASPAGIDSMGGSSAAMLRLRSLIRQAAATSLSVLIRGETGTGKDLVARAIHEEGPRRGRPFISVSCAALPEELLEAELFGSLRGAFSGAEKDRAGLLRDAHGGSFLFDGIGELPLPLQGKLLRILDTRRLRPLGGSEEVEIDVRFLFATHQDLQAMVEEGRFRGELLYRLKGLEIVVPPLRERSEDIRELVERFLTEAKEGNNLPHIGPEALAALCDHPWPGNVRELKTVVSRLALAAPNRMDAEALRTFLDRAPAPRLFPADVLRGRSLEKLKAELEREYLIQLYGDLGGDMRAVAAALSVSLQAVYKKLKTLGLRPGDLGARRVP